MHLILAFEDVDIKLKVGKNNYFTQSYRFCTFGIVSGPMCKITLFCSLFYVGFAEV